MQVKDYETVALGYIAEAFAALEKGTQHGRETARLYSDQVLRTFDRIPQLNAHGSIVRERWLALQEARYSNILTIDVEIEKVQR